MLARVRAHLTFANVVSLMALFVALSGGAYALTIPKNSVGAKQLKKNAVTRSKIKNRAVTSLKVRDRSLLATDFKAGQLPAGPQGLQGPKGDPGTAGSGGAPSGPAGGSLEGTYPDPTLVPNSVGSSQIADDAVNSAKVLDGTLSGDDIVESSLGQVPSALLGGFGRTGTMNVCNPDSATFLTCASVNLNLSAATRVLVIGRFFAHSFDSNDAQGTCALATAPGGTVPNTTAGIFVPGDDSEHVPLVGITAVLPAGPTVFALDCNEVAGNQVYEQATVTAVAISPN